MRIRNTTDTCGKWMVLLTGFVVMAICSGVSAADKSNGNWQHAVRQRLATLGHRNWVVIADSAYPDQVAPGIETVYVGGDQLAAVRSVLKMVNDARHVRPVVFLDGELTHVPESDAVGIGQYRKDLQAVLAKAKPESLPHEKIIAKLDEAGQTFRVLIIKTDLTLPYTSVFVRLDAGYWSDAAERRLRATIKKNGSK